MNVVFSRNNIDISSNDLDTIHAIALVILKSYFLIYQNSTLSERLYGLTRVNIKSDGSFHQLSTSQKISKSLYLVVLPVLFDKLYQTIQYQSDSGTGSITPPNAHVNNLTNSIAGITHTSFVSSHQSERENVSDRRPLTFDYLIPIRVRKLFRRFTKACLIAYRKISEVIFHFMLKNYKRITLCLRLCNLLQQLRYCMFHTHHFDILMALMRTAVVREQRVRYSPVSGADTDANNKISVAAVHGTQSSTSTTISSLILGALITIRSIEWFLRTDVDTAGVSYFPVIGSTTTKFPPAPPVMTAGRGFLLPPADKKLCPLCRRERSQPAVSTGGYIFCFSCLIAALRTQSRCPVTGVPCRDIDVIRLFESEAVGSASLQPSSHSD